jgi:hypothetical protein
MPNIIPVIFIMMNFLLLCAQYHALLIVSSEQTTARLQRSRGREGHQRRRRGPSMVPAKVHKRIVPPYQSATKGSESSAQCSA